MSAVPGPPLATRLAWLGAISVLAFTVIVPFAIGLAPFAPVLVVQPEEIAFFDRLADQLGWLPAVPAYLRAAIRGGLMFADPVWRVVAATGPLAVASVAMLIAVRQVQNETAAEYEAADRVAVRVAVLLTLVGVFAFPTYTPDFFLSVAWGRMFADGQNAYYLPLTPEYFGTLPGQRYGPEDLFTYGPLWAFLTRILGWLCGRRELVEYVVYKGVLAGAWLGTLAALRRLAGRRGPKARLLITCLVGWLPAGVYFAVAEGHNDIVMVCFMSLWLEAADRGDHRLTPVWLACSALIKFVTLPLIAIELLAAQRAGVLFSRRYIVTMLMCGLASVLAMLAFYEGGEFLQGTRRMQNWIFWTPSTYIIYVAALVGQKIKLTRLDNITTILGIALTAVVLWRAIRRPDRGSWVIGGLAVMTCMLLTLVGHVWPWFSLWLLPFMAILWPTRPAGVLLTFLLIVPSVNLGWILAPDWRYREAVTAPMYTIVLLVMMFLWLRGPGAMGSPVADPSP